MTVRLILNADDFGLTPGINKAIMELHQAGILSSATLMAAGGAFEDAARVALETPDLGVGCHIVLTDGLPASPPKSIPTLLHTDGVSFRPSLGGFVRGLLSGQISETDIEREAEAQISRLLLSSVRVTHLDTHKHTHMFPKVTRPLLRVAEAHALAGIRNPFEASWAFALGHGSPTRRMQMRVLERLRGKFFSQPQIRDGRVKTTDGSVGISATGSLDRSSISQMVAALPAGTWELVCHPGYDDAALAATLTRLRTHRETERLALFSVIPEILSHPDPPQIINYASL